MRKEELEERIGYEITFKGFNILNDMYMACDLNKDDFSKLIKHGAKIYKVDCKNDIDLIKKYQEVRGLINE